MIRTYLRWQDLNPAEVHGHCAVVIDVLRWSTVVATALQNGADWVEAYATPDVALARAAHFGRSEVILGGERDNVRLPGFDLGNSPLEYTSARLNCLPVITTTTNGTQGLLAASEAQTVIVVGFVNLLTAIDVIRHELHEGRPIALIACGQAGHLAEEDVACAGAIATELRSNMADTTTDAACATWSRLGRDTERVMESSAHAARLTAAGFGADVAYAASIGVVECIPRMTSPRRLTATYGVPPEENPI